TNYSDQQPISNENISTPIVSSYAPQYVGPQQPIENIPSPLGSFNMTTIHPSQSEIFSFDIPGFKIIVIPTFSQQDNTYLNYSSSITDTQFDQFQQ
ncbi:9123_t:CDS:1, partial [Rhizophagus irregularis]